MGSLYSKREEIIIKNIAEEEAKEDEYISELVKEYAMVNKRDVIREGIQRCILPIPGAKTWVTELIAGEITKDIMFKLDELGLVIKVDKPLPEYEFFDCADIKKSKQMQSASDHTVKLMLKDGYEATESLIEEG